MNLLAIGVSHRTAPIDIRERLWLGEEEVRLALPQLREKFLRECVLLSTCNRTEIYGIGNEDRLDPEAVREFIIDFKQATPYLFPKHFYTFTGWDAVRQLLRVSTGVDSMMLGDVQILGQVKEAYRLAQACKTVGFFASRLFQTAFHAGKRGRSETEISEGAVSISYGAIELASKIFDDLAKKRVLLIGAGKTSELTIKHLRSKRIGRVLIANRTRSRAEELAEKFEGQVTDFENLKSGLREIDIVITSIDSPNYVLTASDLSVAMKERGNRPLLIIDIGVPRNVDPASNKIENVFLHDIDALQLIVDKNLDKRRKEIPKVEQIIEEELNRFLLWHNSLELNPTIEQLQSMAEEIRQQEVEKHRNRFRPEEHETLDMLTRRIIKKILHKPITNLRNGRGNSDDESLRLLEAARKLFGFQTPEEKTPGDQEEEHL